MSSGLKLLPQGRVSLGMNATTTRIKTSLIALLAIVALGCFTTARADAGSRNTASYVKAQIDKLDGKSVSLDVAFVRMLRPFTTHEEFVLLGAATVDEDNHSGGGGILVVANKADKDALVRRYGTTIDRDRGDGVETKSMRGVVHLVTGKEGRGKYVYLDLTDGAFNPTEQDVREIAGERFDGALGLKKGGKRL